MRPLTAPPSKTPLIKVINGNQVMNNSVWINWIYSFFERSNKANVVPAYAKADLTTANNLAPADWVDSTFSAIIYVTDATGGASTAYSDGTSWISHKTGAAV